jgi:hypothetical protein
MTRSPTAEFGDACADFCDHAGHLVAEDARGGVRAHVNFLEIRTANAAGGDLDEQLAGSDARNGDGFKTHVIDAAVNNRAHRCGDLGIDLKSGTRDLGSHSVL